MGPLWHERWMLQPAHPVVMMVGHFVRVDTVLVQCLRHRVVKRFQGAPRPVQKIVPSRVHFPTAGHAGHRADLGGQATQRVSQLRHNCQVELNAKREPCPQCAKSWLSCVHGLGWQIT